MREKQILLNASVSECFNMYVDFWQPNIIKRHEFLGVSIDRDLLLQECENYSMIYKQKQITYIPLVSLHRSLPHISTKGLSEILNTTVIYYAEWEEVFLEVYTAGREEFVLNIDLDGRLVLNTQFSDRFSELYSSLRNNLNYESGLGDDMREIWKLLQIPPLSKQNPDFQQIEEAISFEFYANWKENSSNVQKINLSKL